MAVIVVSSWIQSSYLLVLVILTILAAAHARLILTLEEESVSGPECASVRTMLGSPYHLAGSAGVPTTN